MEYEFYSRKFKRLIVFTLVGQHLYVNTSGRVGLGKQACEGGGFFGETITIPPVFPGDDDDTEDYLIYISKKWWRAHLS